MEGNHVTTLLTSVQGSLNDSIGAALPVAGTIMAAVAGIFIGVKIFKKLTGART